MFYTRDLNEMDTKLINDILHIDSLVYPAHYQGTFSEIHDRYKTNRDMFVLLYADEMLIGYLCMFPIKTVLYEQILQEDRFFDSDIPGNMLETFCPNNSYKLYLISAAIHPKYQKQGLSNLLITGFHKYVNDKKKNSITFSSALSTSITMEGRQMLRKMGFSEIANRGENFKLHELVFDEVFYSNTEEVK